MKSFPNEEWREKKNSPFVFFFRNKIFKIIRMMLEKEEREREMERKYDVIIIILWAEMKVTEVERGRGGERTRTT